MPEYARTRADVDLRTGPAASASIMDRFPTDCEVEILETTQDGWYKIKSVRLARALKGYVPRKALIFPTPAQPPVFPTFPVSETESVPSVPLTLPLAEFRQWQAASGEAGGRPGWLSEEAWNALSAEQQTALAEGILASIRQDPARWEAWVAGVTASKRLNEAVMGEWIILLEGGREVYAIRDHYIYKQPVQDANYFGCAMKGQVMHWSGIIRTKDENGTLRRFYEVSFYRMSREMTGWFRADLASLYTYPTADNDPTVPGNAAKVFDLAKPVLRLPQDHEIADAKAARYTGAQYIDIKDVLNKSLRHFCLCGEFCVATLAGRDIIPTLQDWCASRYWRVNAILGNAKEGTGVGDLQSLLKVVKLNGEPYSSMPTTIQQIKERLDGGQLAVASCKITAAGTVKVNGTIPHWVVLEDVLPVGNSGWVRIYNPFQNREEVYPYDLFMTSGGGGIGLWITGGSRLSKN